MTTRMAIIVEELAMSIKQMDWEMAKLKELEFYFVAAKDTTWTFNDTKLELEKAMRL